ncbi:MAG: Sca4 family protein [Nostocales cyanobacterium LE14-WE4]|nr:Sca4 family protein [Nostocales cyanobacterium LE14-WE4]
MSKYVYEQFVTPDQQEKMTNDASGVRKTYFAAGKLDPLTPEKRLNTLYSAIRDVEGDETHPIVKALKNYMLSNGSSQKQIDDILRQGKEAYEASKEQPKTNITKEVSKAQPLEVSRIQPDAEVSVPVDRTEPLSPLGVPTKVNSPELQAPVVSKPQPGEKGFTYQRVELPHPFEGNLLKTYIEVSPSEYARNLLSEKTREEQANILYSAQRGDDNNVIKALEKHLTDEGVFSREQIESIKRAAILAELTISREQNEITAAAEGVSPISMGKVPSSEMGTLKKADLSPLESVVIENSPEAAVQLAVSMGKVPSSEMGTLKKADLSPLEELVRVDGREAQDSVILGGNIGGSSRVTALSSSEVDPITEAIRKEILAEQQKLIKAQIALSNPSVNAMDSQRFREYLTSDPGKEEAAKVFAKPEIQTALNKIEVEGYKKVHAEFSDSFKNVNWTPDQVVAAGQPKTKTSEITNEDGLVVAKIKETTHDIAPLAVTLDNGDKVNVKSYRTIDFPKELEAGKGPLHLSMAVKDQNGRNISEKEAVYFTAHYDEQGKLTEISSPIPVKFMGNDDKAVGYIERNGKVYTLPVTQGKYKEMMKEVAKNQGMAVDLSQEVAQEAQDLALTKEKSRTPVLERDEEAVQPQKKTGRSEDSIALPETDAIPLQMVSVQGTAQDKTTAIDNMLRGVSPDRIVATLKDQVAKGGSEAVGLIVEATKEGRTGDHPGVHTLTAAQFKEVYETGMNAAKVISDKRAPEKQTKHAEDSMRNIHSACNKLTKPAAVDPADHMRTKRLHDRNFELKNLQRGR